jgi:hypothetical protein
MAGVNSANQLGYVRLESTFGVAVTPIASSAFRIISLQVDPVIEERLRPDKNGSLDETVGISGVRSASWRMRCSLAGSSGAGVAPDIGPFLQAAFGKAPTVAAGTSVTYELEDASPSLTIWSYWRPSNASQEAIIGAVVNALQLEASAGSDPTIELSGTGLFAPGSDTLADLDATGAGGLATWPTEPASPTTNGNMIDVTAGSATLDGNAVTEIRTFRLGIEFNRDIPTDVIFGGKYGAAPGQDRRRVTFSTNIYDQAGDVNFSALKKKAQLKTPVDGTFVLGAIAGHTLTIPLKQILLGNPVNDDGQRRKAISFENCRANATAAGKDSVKFIYS